MALRLTLRRLGHGTSFPPRDNSRALSWASLSPQKLKSHSLAEGGGSCEGGATPPCPPCEPAPQPDCRARTHAARRALRVVCCVPPQGSRPPCPTRDPTCAITCRDALDPSRSVSTNAADKEQECPVSVPSRGEETDRVARRLARAKLSQRRNYECEVAQRAAEARPGLPPRATYRLGVERECARATDGALYTVPSTDRRPGCGPDCTPPPPRCVELAPDDNCRIRDEARLDPCAHRPRIIVEIDRCSTSAVTTKEVTSCGPADATQSACNRPRVLYRNEQSTGKKTSQKKSPCSNERSVPSKGFKSRIIKSLNLGGSASSKGGGSGSSGGGAECPRSSCGGACAGGGARRAGDAGWCASPPQPAPAPSRCRRPGVADRLRARSATLCPESRSARKLHTSAAGNFTAAATTGTGGLEDALRKKSTLKEAGIGRVVVDCGKGGPKRPESPAGRLELRVPPGTERVSVRVSLDGAVAGPSPGACPPPSSGKCGTSGPKSASTPAPVCTSSGVPGPGSPMAADPCRSVTLTGGKKDSWLSIKNIQKKLTGCSGDEQASSSSEAASPPPACPGRPECPPACPGRPECPPQCPVSPRAGVPARSPSPPSVCEGRSKKPDREPKKSFSTINLLPNSVNL